MGKLEIGWNGPDDFQRGLKRKILTFLTKKFQIVNKKAVKLRVCRRGALPATTKPLFTRSFQFENAWGQILSSNQMAELHQVIDKTLKLEEDFQKNQNNR